MRCQQCARTLRNYAYSAKSALRNTANVNIMHIMQYARIVPPIMSWLCIHALFRQNAIKGPVGYEIAQSK